MAAGTRVWGYIKSSDYRLMRRMNRWYSPGWFRVLMLAATRLGDGWAWYALALLILGWGGSSRFVVVGAAGLSVISGIVLFSLIKKISRRKRPCEFEPHCWAIILPPDEFSFPSGHSITAFAIMLSVGRFHPHLMPALLLLAVCIATSRVVLGMHFLSDVLAGSLIGTILGYAAFRFFA
jgi:undecaprenyl-diphosphatase